MKLNVGCGSKRVDGYVGVDRYRSDAVDVICDISAGLPFASHSVHEILLDDVVEHIADLAEFFRELVRVASDGCVIKVKTPHFSALASWRDPTHIHHLSYFSPDHFEKRWVAEYTGHRLRVLKKELRFRGRFSTIGRLIFRFSPKFYEQQACFVFRARTVYFELGVIKAGAGERAAGAEPPR